MKAGIGQTRWRPLLGVVAVGVFACSLTLHGAPRDGGGKSGRASLDQHKGWSVTDVPHAPPVHAYRAETVLRMEFNGENPLLYVVGGRDDPWGGIASPMSGGPTGDCELNVECDDCIECTTDTCTAEVCVSDLLAECETCEDSVFCNGRERCDGAGGCLAATAIKDPPWNPCEKLAKMVCDEESGASQQGECVLPCRADNACPNVSDCDGTDTCVYGNNDVALGWGGYCLGGAIAGTPCTAQGQCGTLCSDGTTTCDPDVQCPGVNGYCNVMTGRCRGGSASGDPCDVSTDCPTDETCGYCAGVCRTTTPPPCGTNVECPALGGTPTSCGKGRCCTPDGANPGEFECHDDPRLTKPECDQLSGRFLGVGDQLGEEGDQGGCFIQPAGESNSGEDFGCPKYEAGITSGTILGDLGIAGVALCNDYLEIGDDYKLSNFTTEDWLELTTVRFIGGWVTGTASRMRVTFYDSSGTFIEDTIMAFTSSGSYLHTVIYGEKPVIPSSGFMTLQAAVQFTPNSKQVWAVVSETTANVGTNDPNFLYVNQCTGGTCTGLQNTHISTLTMADGSPVLNGVLAFELIGNKTTEPLGACCRPDSGECRERLRWDCESLGGLYQGDGASCNVCSNDPFGEGCDTDDDCERCTGGSNPGTACTQGGGECLGGGFCHVVVAGDCLPVPPACQQSACCNTISGTCSLVGGAAGAGFCSGGGGQVCYNTEQCVTLNGGVCSDGAGDVGGEACNTEAECVGFNGAGSTCDATTSECVAACGANSYSRGFGTDCDPDCCVQQLSGADTCKEAPIIVIPVPAPGQPPVQRTFTGNNKLATFGDYVDGSCTSGIFNEDGATRDRGWWHAFSIDACANLRVDLCCTWEISGQVHQPQWATLFTQCNDCGGGLGNAIIGEPPAAPGDLTDNNERGDPFCTEADDLWQTFGPAPAGIYYFPIYTATGGHFGEYQLHITVQACQERACCLETATCIGTGIVSHGDACTTNRSCPRCVGGTNPDGACTTVGEVDGDCPGNGVCTGVCINGLNDGDACVGTADCPVDPLFPEDCDGAFCPCKGNCVADCDDLNEADCTLAGGFWMGFRNLPTDEIESLCSTGVCSGGSCCTAPGECQDWSNVPAAGCDLETGEATDGRCCDPDNPDTCMEKKLCDILNGTFVGGGRCDFPTVPCPACEIQGESNCQLQAPANTVVEFHFMSDLTVPPNGVVVADDFIPSGDTINDICVFGSYVDPTRDTATPAFGCAGMVTDQFRVRVYDDNNGLPGNIVAERWVCESDGGSMCNPPNHAQNDGVVFKGPEAASYLTEVYDLPTFIYTLSLTNPITGLTPGQRYFLEISNNTSQIPGDVTLRNFCRWQWANINQGDRGNDQLVVGTDDRPAPNPVGTLSGYWGQAYRWTDMAFCLDQDFEAPSADNPLYADLRGACCTCATGEGPGSCIPNETLLECHFGGISDSATEGVWSGGLGCSDNDPISGQHVCAVQDGDNCSGAAGSVAAGIDCAVDAGVPGRRLECTGTCSVNYDTACATTDGPADDQLGMDLWLAYTADCTGSVLASLCANGNYIGSYDSAVEIYQDETDPYTCPCPGTSTATLVQGGELGDEGCNGLHDAGPGIVGDLNRIPTTPGECWLIRIAGWVTGDGGGKGMLDVACIPLTCSASSTPEYAPLVADDSNPSVIEDMVTTRALTFKAGDAGGRQAIRVSVAAMPTGFEYAESFRSMWVGPPRKVTENAGKTDPDDPFVQGFPVLFAAELQCQPYYRDWHGACAAGFCIGGVAEGELCTTQDDCYQAIVVTGGILNSQAIDGGILMSDGATYTIEVTSDDCTDLTDTESYSLPLTIINEKWGDVVGTFGGTRYTLGEGVVNITTDVTAILNKFKNIEGAPIKARTDIEPEGFDLKINISDITLVLNAFGGFPYAFNGPDVIDPCVPVAP